MGNEYFLYYAEGNIVCIVILALILINDRMFGIQQEKQIWFNRTIFAHILYFASDNLWAAINGGQLPSARPLVGLVNLANYILLSLIAFEWFIYMAVAERVPFVKSRKKRMLCAIPMIVSVAVLLIAYAADPYHWISEAGVLNDLYYPMLVTAPVIYLLVALVISLINAEKAETRDDKRTFLLIGIYPIVIVVFGIFQLTVVDAPVFCFGVTVMVLFFYLQNTQMLISVDALTRLNNRGQINRFMEQMRYRENVRVFVMLIDVDRFKPINDTYGHAEGDQALILVSEALKQTCERLKTPAFIGRYGGDEFTVILQNPEENEFPEQVAEMIRGMLSQKQRENDLPYDLKVSIGYEELRDGGDTMMACMVRADEKLYIEKRVKDALR